MTETPLDPPDNWDEYLKNYKYGDEARELKRIEREVLADPGPRFTLTQIQRDALTERKARFTEFVSQKNYEMLNWFLDNPPEMLPADLLYKTQALTKNTHKMEVIND